MSEGASIFNAICIMTALAQAYNYRMLGKHREVSKYLNLFICSGFFTTELIVAITQNVPWGYWCYIVLSTWGIWNFWGQKPE